MSRTAMKIAFILSFLVVFAIGFALRPKSLDPLWMTNLALAASCVLTDQFSMWYAKRNKIGVRTEDFGLAQATIFFNNPWTSGWAGLHWMRVGFQALWIAFIYGTTLLCGAATYRLLVLGAPL